MSADTPLIDAPAIDKVTLRELMQPSLFQWSIRVAGDWLLIIGPMVFAGYTRHWASYVFAVLMAGIGQHRLAMLAHEGTHRQISRNKRLNDFLTGLFCMWPFGNPVGGWRRYHFTHHRYTNTDGDSELWQKAKSSPAWDLPATRWTVLKYLVEDVCLLHVKELAYRSRSARPGTGWIDGTMPNIWLLCMAGTLIYFGQWWVIVVWYLGMAMVFWPIFRLRIWSEHVGTHDVHRIHAPWYVRWWWLPHNTWCHYEHHYYPQVPCWNLPTVRQLMGNTPEVLPLFAIIHLIEHAPPTVSGEPIRVSGEGSTEFDPRVVAEIRTEWEAALDI